MASYDIPSPPVPEAAVEPIENLFQRRTAVESLLNRTSQRRMMLETLASSRDKTDELSAILTQPFIATLFDTGEVADGIIVEGGPLQKIIFGDDGQVDPKNINTYLLEKVALEYPELTRVKLEDLPIEIFVLPNSRAGLAAAAALVAGDRKTNSIAQYLQAPDTTPGLVEPMLETVLEAELDRLTAKIGVEVLSDSKLAEKYYTGWLKSEHDSQDRIVFTPSYRRAAKKCHEFMRLNGKNRSIARSLAYGPPGRGKTEFYRAINRRDRKETMIISGRPHLGYEELIAAPEIVRGSDKATAYAQLAGVYSQMDALLAARSIIKSSKNYAASAAKYIDRSLTRAELKSFQKQFFIEMGVAGEIAEQLTEIEDERDSMAIIRHRPQCVELNDAFVAHLLTLAYDQVYRDNDTQRYLQGLIITADKLGMRVVIDEADKMYTGQPGESLSFGGLEYILGMDPKTRIESIGHRFSDDFCIDLSMNLPSIPDPIKSRFVNMAFYFEENAYDRAAIVAAAIPNEGQPILAPEEQDLLLFLTTFAWPAISRAGKVDPNNINQWDLRHLQRILSYLIHDRSPRNETVGSALAEFGNLSNVSRALARFPALQSRVHLKPHLLGAPDAPNMPSFPASSPLLEAVISGPPALQEQLSNHVVSLTHEEIDLLDHAQARKILPTTITQAESQNAIITLINPQSEAPILRFTSKLDGTTVLYDVQISREPDGSQKSVPIFPKDNTPLELHSVSAWGTTVLIKNGDDFAAVDATGVISGDIDQNISALTVRPVSELIINPKSIALTPDGFHVYAIQHSPQTDKDEIVCYPLGLSMTDRKATLLPSFAIRSPLDQTPIDIEMSTDGKYALVTYQNKKSNKSVNILKLHESQRTQQEAFVADSNWDGEGWKLMTFENTLFLFNTVTREGHRVS